MRVVVVGTGRMGRIHAKNVQKNPRLQLAAIAVANVAKESNKKFGEELGVPVIRFEDAVSDKSVEGVVIASSTNLHHVHIIEALKHNKQVFCDKPVALDPSHIDECFKEANLRGIKLLCGYQRRFDPSFVRLKEAIKAGKIGKPNIIRLTSRDHPPPAIENLSGLGSFFQDFSTHDVDAARFLLEEDPVDVWATASNALSDYETNKTDDTAVLVLKFASGAMCVIDNSRRTNYGYDIRVEVIGDKGMLELRNPSATSVVFANEDGIASDVLHYSFPERFDEAYYRELDHWVDVVQKKAEPLVTHQDCKLAAEITIRAQVARDTQVDGKKPVSFDAPAEPAPITGEIGVCFVGVGRMGVIRAEATRKYPNCKAMYVVDIDTARVAEVAKMYGCTPLHTNDIETALKDPKVHAVFISTTSHTHFDIIVAAAKAGKNIFCEKPLALSAKETQVCVEEAKKAGVVLYCGFQRRSDPDFLKMREKMIASKGKIELVRISSRDGANHNPISYLLSSGGYFYDSLIHDFDEARWIVGEEPISVYCTGTAFFKEIREAGDIDAVVVVLRFPSGVVVSIDNHRRAMYGYDQRLEVHTSAGQFQVQNQARSVVVESNGKGIISDNPPAGLDRYKEAYEAEVFHFFDLLSKKGVKPRVLPEDCLYGAYIAEAAKESLKTGKVVSLL